MLTPIASAAPAHLQLGEGLLLANVPLEALLNVPDIPAVLAIYQATDHLLGATVDGCEFRCAPGILHTEAQKRTPVQGTLLPGVWQVSLSGTLADVTRSAIARLLNLPLPADGIFVPGDFTPLETLLFVGDTMDGRLLIEMTAPLSTGGLTLRTRRQGTGQLPFTFTAQRPALNGSDPPCRIALMKGGAPR